MFTRQDHNFDQIAADPVRRREGIASLSVRRNVMFWCAVVMTLCAFTTFFLSVRSAPGGAAIGFAAAVQWMLLFKLESDLRLLRVIERLRLSENDRTSD